MEEPTQDQKVAPKSIGEEEQEPQKDHDDPESEKEQPNIVLFTLKQLEVLLKMNRPDFSELIAALKGGFRAPARPKLCTNQLVVWFVQIHVSD